MQAEKTVEVDGRALHALPRLRNRDGRANAVVILFAERHDDIQSVSGSPLKEHDQFFLVRHWSGYHRALEERGNRAHADHGDSATFHKNATRNVHGRSPSLPTAIDTAGNGPDCVAPAFRRARGCTHYARLKAGATVNPLLQKTLETMRGLIAVETPASRALDPRSWRRSLASQDHPGSLAKFADRPIAVQAFHEFAVIADRQTAPGRPGLGSCAGRRAAG